MTDNATRADGAEPPPAWTPRKALASGTISAGDKVGMGHYAERLRRYLPGDRDMGHAEETILDDWRVRERAPGRWVTDTEDAP